jgi:hypothetical protein
MCATFLGPLMSFISKKVVYINKCSPCGITVCLMFVQWTLRRIHFVVFSSVTRFFSCIGEVRPSLTAACCTSPWQYISMEHRWNADRQRKTETVGDQPPLATLLTTNSIWWSLCQWLPQLGCSQSRAVTEFVTVTIKPAC